MGRINTAVGRGMAVRLVLLRTDPDDTGRIPLAAYDGDIETIAPGVRAFRRADDRVFVVWKVTASTINSVRYVLAVVYTPGSARDAQAPFTALAGDFGVELVKSWPTVLHADGTLRVPALDSDGTAVGTGVKAAWPNTWRARLPADPDGALPTGDRCIAQVLA